MEAPKAAAVVLEENRSNNISNFRQNYDVSDYIVNNANTAEEI